MSDAGDEHEPSLIVDGNDDAVVADSDAVVVATCEARYSGWTGIEYE